MRGFTGFGSGMVMAPVFAILFGPVETVVMVIVLEVVVTAQMIPGVRDDIDWRFVFAMGAVAALFMPLGNWLLVNVDAEAIGRAMAAIVLVFVFVLMTGWRYRGGRRTPVTLGVGALSGVMLAATSLGNPPVILYLMAGRDTAAETRANMTAYFAVTFAVLLALMSVRGLMTWEATARAGILLPLFMAAAWVGGRMFRKSGEAMYRRVALAFLMGVGIYGLVR
jgi:hypothetical protein